MDETIYTLVRQVDDTWRAQADDGHEALLVPDPGIDASHIPLSGNHAVLAALEGFAEIDGERWLAYRWASGDTVAELIEQGGPIDKMLGLRMMMRVLDGVAHARLTGCSTGPIVAERILVVADGSPMWAGILPSGSPGVEPIHACGELLFRILTGVVPISDAAGEFPFASSVTPEIDIRLDDIVTNALKGKQGGYESVLDLRAALGDYLDDLELLEVPDHEEDAVSAFMRRMGKADDFPALSRSVSALNKIADADSEKLQSLASIILRDFSLTNKVLRLANSASYGQFGGATSTISRAVMVLGFNAVKALALTVVLIEHLTNREQAGDIKDEVAKAFFSSLLARKLAERCGYSDLEEARVAGMFHLLGKLLVKYYLRDDDAVITATVALGSAEETVVRSRIGASYEELGMGVARSWHIPEKLVFSMGTEDEKPRAPKVDADWLKLFANTAVGLMRSCLAEDEPTRYKLFLITRDRFSDALRLAERDLRGVINDAIRETLHEAAIFGLDANSAVLMALRKLAGLPVVGGKPAPAPSSLATVDVPTSAKSQPSVAHDEQAVLSGPKAGVNQNVRLDRPEVLEALASCVQDVTETMVGEFKLNDLLRMILETLYCSLRAEHVLLATRSMQRNALVGRFGFGDKIDEFVARFVLPIDDSTDILRACLVSNSDLTVADLHAPNVQSRLPAWYVQIATARSALLLPIVIDRKSVGLLYADHAAPDGIQLGDKELSLVKTLRNQAILAIRQKSPSS